MKTIKDIFSLNLSTKSGATQFYNIINRYIINKKDKKELFKEIKNINKGEDSFDYGLEYYKIDLNKLDNYEKANEIMQIFVANRYNGYTLNIIPIFHAIHSNKLYYNHFDPINGAFSVSNITVKDGSFDKTQKQFLNDLLSTYNASLKDELFIKITAKEYYSLLD